ncbi:MAG: TetR/AcrR family transcriptional regulator [Actinomycetota bacterium]
MATPSEQRMPQETTTKKKRLSAERVLDGAMALADEIGIEALTIRKLADALDTKPMTIYHHIPNKEAIIDGLVDRVFAEIERPPPDLHWREAIRRRCVSAREALSRHPWAAPLMESRTNPGPETLGHHNAVLGCFLDAGLSMELTAHAYALVDSYVYGFALQEANLPATGGMEMQELVAAMSAHLEGYPHLQRFTVEHVLQPGYDFTAEFDFGLDLILDGLVAVATAG